MKDEQRIVGRMVRELRRIAARWRAEAETLQEPDREFALNGADGAEEYAQEVEQQARRAA